MMNTKQIFMGLCAGMMLASVMPVLAKTEDKIPSKEEIQKRNEDLNKLLYKAEDDVLDAVVFANCLNSRDAILPGLMWLGGSVAMACGGKVAFNQETRGRGLILFGAGLASLQLAAWKVAMNMLRKQRQVVEDQCKAKAEGKPAFETLSKELGVDCSA